MVKIKVRTVGGARELLFRSRGGTSKRLETTGLVWPPLRFHKTIILYGTHRCVIAPRLFFELQINNAVPVQNNTCRQPNKFRSITTCCSSRGILLRSDPMEKFKFNCCYLKGIVESPPVPAQMFELSFRGSVFSEKKWEDYMKGREK